MMENGHNLGQVDNYISPSESFEAENVITLNNTGRHKALKPTIIQDYNRHVAYVDKSDDMTLI